VTTLQTADGRLLRSAAPSGTLTMGMPSVFPPMWSDGERAGEDRYLRSYSRIYQSQPVVAGVVDKLARRIATLPFDGYQRGPRDAREVVRGDTLDSLIRRPMPRWSTAAMLHHVAQSLLLHGNALLVKVRGADREAPPEMLWPLDWEFVNAYAPVGGRIEWWSTYQFDGEERFIAVDDTVHFSWESPHGQLGVSPLAKLGVTVRLEDAAQRYQTSAFRNGARPGGVVTLPAGSNPTPAFMFDATATTENMHKGVDRAFSVGLLAPGADWKPMSMTAVEAELIQQRYLNWEEIGMVYDMGGPLMNDFRRATYSNVAELQRALYRDVIPPWLGLIEQTWQSQLLDSEPAWMDRFVAFDLTDKLKGDPVELANALKLQVEAGLITRNEARRILNMPPVEDLEADKLFINANNQAPIDYHRNNEVLTDNSAGREVNPGPGTTVSASATNAAMPPPSSPAPRQ